MCKKNGKKNKTITQSRHMYEVTVNDKGHKVTQRHGRKQHE